jgi:mannose-1-phosphate guanylyltransferase
VLEPETFDRIPKDTSWSIERSYFPSLIERGETFVAYVYDGYWIDIGTPEKYAQVHRDIMDGRYQAPPFSGRQADAVVDGAGRAHRPEGGDRRAGVHRRGRRGEGGHARVGPHTVLGRRCHVEEDATVRGSIVWANGRIGREASIEDAILGRHCHVGRGATVAPGTVLGDKSVVTDYSRL